MRATFSTKKWYMSHINDPYVKLSKKLQFRSRAAFKLIHLNDKHQILTQDVLDLGSAPGSWSQVASQKHCKVVAIDLLQMAPISNVQFIRGDITNQFLQKHLLNMQFDVVLSDMAPNFSGDHEADHQDISKLNSAVQLISCLTLKEGGSMIMKTLHGSQEKQNYDFHRQFFKEFYREKPLSSKSESSELFYVGKQFNKQALLEAQQSQRIQQLKQELELLSQ